MVLCISEPFQVREIAEESVDGHSLAPCDLAEVAGGSATEGALREIDVIIIQDTGDCEHTGCLSAISSHHDPPASSHYPYMRRDRETIFVAI